MKTKCNLIIIGSRKSSKYSTNSYHKKVLSYTSFCQDHYRHPQELHPFAFLVALMKAATVYIGAGIPWMYQDCLTDLDFADDLALFTKDETWLQSAT